MTTVLALSDVEFSWRKNKGVLDRLSLAVAPGEHVGLLGPNGSGKSTALSLCAGLYRPQGGRITWRFDGRELAPQDRRARARFGVVFQHPSLDLQLSARENLQLAGHIAGLPRHTVRQQVDALLASSGITDRADDRVKTFSGGMRRRLDLARAVLAEPEALLLDEPTTGLDAEAFDRFWQSLGALRRATGLTLVVATHRPEEAARCDRLVMIDRGRAIHHGTPDEIVRTLGEDLIAIRAERPDEIAGTIAGRFGLVTRKTAADETTCEVPRGDDGARLLVALVECFPSGRLQAIELRRPTIADAFLKLTGARLGEDVTSRDRAEAEAA